MALFDLTTAGDALNDLFDRERKAILGGRFDVLERLAHEKERLFDAVQRKPGAPDQLARLRGKADRNRDLLAAMERGVRAATKRLKQLSGTPAALQTYDALGQRQTISDPKHALQRRA